MIHGQKIHHQGHVNGMNWYGMEIGYGVMGGLWARDIKDHIRHMNDLGINVIRVPWAFEGVHNGDYDRPIASHFLSACSSCFVNMTTWDIIDLLFEETSELGMSIILDLHRLVYSSTNPLWYSKSISPIMVLDAWNVMFDRYMHYPNLFAIDLYNEPHGNVTFGTDDTSTDWKMFVLQAYTHFYDRLVETDTWMLVNGIHWGEDMRDFSSWIPSVDHIILSPHSYGPTLTYIRPDLLLNQSYLFQRWDTMYGYLSTSWPMIIGEWGANQNSKNDLLWMSSFVQYLQSRSFCGSCFWAWNPDSKDVKGFLNSDWTTPNAAKWALLQPLWQRTDTHCPFLV